MKELKISKFSKRWFIKRNDKLTKSIPIILWLLPILGGILAAYIELKNIGMSIVFGLLFMLDLIILSYTVGSIDENYDDYIYRLISKQKRKQDRKWKKWLI